MPRYQENLHRLPTTRSDAIAFYRDRLLRAAAKGEEHLLRAKRWLSANDLFYLMLFTCRRRDINRDWLFDRCREVQAEPDGRIDLWARFHYKSSVMSFGLNILELLNDPEITIGIFADTNKVAKPFLRQIKTELETNRDLKAQFPDILWAEPKRQAPKWSEDEGIVVRRQGNPKESTVEAYGLIDGQPTGRHFKLLDYDDIVTQDTVGTSDQLAKVKERLRMSFNLGTGGATRRRFKGTRYHQYDAYEMIISDGLAVPRLYPVTRDGTETGEPVLMTRAEVAHHRKDLGPYIFSAQMLLNPTADKLHGFRPEWLRFWPGRVTSNLSILIIVDPSSGKKTDRGDFTSIWVLGYGRDRNYYMLDKVRDRLNLTQRGAALMALHRKWTQSGRVRAKVGYEEYGLQADIDYIKTVQEQENYRFEIIPLGGSLSKDDRIKRLVPTFEQGRIFLLEGGLVRTLSDGTSANLVRTFIEDEYLAYPLPKHDDSLDGLSRIHDEEMQPFEPSEPAPSEIKDAYDFETPEPNAWMAN